MNSTSEIAGLTSEDVEVNGVRLRLHSAGTGDPVILLHGFPDSHLLWRHQIPALVAAGHRVLAPDLRGFGESDRPEDTAGYRMPNLVADVTGLLDHAGVDRAALVGHDWGAGLAWQVALRAPERVRRLAVLSVGHGGADGGIEQRQRSWYMLWFLFPEVAERVLPAHDWQFFRQWAWGLEAGQAHEECARQIADLSRPGALTAALNWYRANISPARYVLTEPIDGPVVQCPAMGVWSSGDRFLGEAQLTDSARFASAGWRYERVEDAGHWIPTEAPGRVADLLVDFLR